MSIIKSIEAGNVYLTWSSKKEEDFLARADYFDYDDGNRWRASLNDTFQS